VGIWATLAAAAAGLLLVEAVALSAWIAETRTHAPLSVVLRTGAAFWLLGNGGHLHLPGGNAGLIPLGLSLLFFAFAMRSGASVARVRPSGPRRANILICGLIIAVPYTVVAVIVAASASGGGLQTSIPSALTGAFVLSYAAGAVGAARELPMAVPRPSLARAAAAGVGVATLVVVAVCAVLAAAMLLLHISDVNALAKPARAGAVGGFGLFTLQAALAPNATVWTFSYLLGPGFSVGAGTSVSPTGVHLGDLPALPMLGGLPAGAAPWPYYILFLVPPAAGALAGIVAVRRMARTPRLPVALGLGGAIAGAMGVIALAAAALSGGPVTRGRLATVGPSPWKTAAFTLLEIGVPAVVAALALTWWRQRAQRAVAAEAAEQTVPVDEHRPGWRERLRLPKPRLAWMRRAPEIALAPVRGLGAGLGIDRLRRPEKVEDDEPLPVVDLVKAPPVAPPRVSLIKFDHDTVMLEMPTEILTMPPDWPVADGSKGRVGFRRRPHLPKRLRRKDKVIKLPD
jgi:hypothetical protein